MQPSARSRLTNSPQKTDSKPTFNSVLEGQTSSGYWGRQSRATLETFVVGGVSNDEAVTQALRSIPLKTDFERAYLTLLALYILSGSFGERSNETLLIVSNAKTWLESVGVTKPAQIVKMFKLALRD